MSSSRTGTVSGEFAGRIDLSEQHVGDAVAVGLTGQPELDDAADRVAPVGGGDGGTVAERDDDARVDGGDGSDQCDLVGRQLDGGAVASFGLVGGRKTEEQHHQFAATARGPPLRPPARSRRSFGSRT